MDAEGIAGLTAAILAGGLGTRLRAAVPDRPKVLAAVNGRPFLAYLLDQLAAAGLRRVVLCTGHLGWQVRRELGARHAGLELVYSQEETPLGTGGALRLALPHLAAPTALVLNGDSYCRCDLAAFHRRHRAGDARASLVVVEMADCSRFGRVETSAGGRITAFAEKDPAVGAGLINAGVYLLDTSLLDQAPPGRALSLERDLLPAWLAEGVMSFPSPGPFLDIGTPESYARASAFFGGLEPA